MNGWDVGVLQLAVTNCNASSGDVKECPYFTYFTDQVANDCFVPPSVDEQTEGWMDKLPGCNPIQAGPERAVMNSNCGATTVIGPPKTYSTDVSSQGWSYVGCATYVLLASINFALLPRQSYGLLIPLNLVEMISALVLSLFEPAPTT